MASVRKESRDLKIRSARVEECAALTNIMLRSAAYNGHYREMIENYPVTPAMVHDNEVWLAEAGGKILGFYRLDVPNADLDLMFVDDRARGTGLGRAMFDHLKAFASAKGLSAVQIVAHPPAADFYRRMGAADVGTCKAKSPDRWDRPILKLAIRA